MLKHKNKLIIILTAVFLFFIAGICFAGQQTGPGSFEKEIQAKLDSLQQEKKFPGATVGIVLEDGTEIVLASGWADIENKIPMKPLDRMFSGSAGKTFVAAVALQLVQEGKLDLEEKVSTYLGKEPWFTRLPNHKDLTVRMIMQHTGGLPRYVFKETFVDQLLESTDKIWKPEELLGFVFDDTPVNEAGKGWSYSDTDYIVLGMIIEKITKNTFYSELDKRILDPFGLIYGHGGFFPGYETQMSYFPKWKIALTVQVNADSLSGKLDGSLNQFIEQLVPILEKYFKK